MQSLHHLLTYAVHNIDHMLRYSLSIYLSSISIIYKIYLSNLLYKDLISQIYFKFNKLNFYIMML